MLSKSMASHLFMYWAKYRFLLFLKYVITSERVLLNSILLNGILNGILLNGILLNGILNGILLNGILLNVYF